MSPDDVPFVCPECGALTVARLEVVSDDLWCFRCQSYFDSKPAVDSGRRIPPALIDALRERTARIRLHWFEGYVSEYPNPIDEETQSVSLNIEAGFVVLHATDGAVHRFDDTRDRDEEGFAIFRERPREVEVEFRPAAVRRKPKGYRICVWYGAWPPPQDADECVSIVRRAGCCPEIAAFASTHLLATGDALHVEY